MLAMGRGLMALPRLLLLDEPSMGLAPKLVEEIFACVRALKAAETTIFLVDQNARAAAGEHHAPGLEYVGAVGDGQGGAQLLEDEQVKEAYLGL